MPFSDDCKCSRREFAQGSLGLGVALATGLMSSPSRAAGVAGYQPRTFTQQELTVVQAIMSRLIPADAMSGGAVEACAYIYLDRALCSRLAHDVPAYRSGLAALDRIAQTQRAASFTALSPQQMDAILKRMERGELPQAQFADGGAGFFDLTRRHTLEGFLSDPLYGGNRDFIGWKTIGYNGVQLTYPPASQELNGRDDRPPQSIANFGGTAAP